MKAPVDPFFEERRNRDPMRLVCNRRLASAALPLLFALGISGPALAQAPAPAAQPPPGSAPPPTSAVPPAAPDAPKRVTYVPDAVQAEIAEQAKQQVLADLKKEGWLNSPVPPNGASGDWTKRFRFYGDVRMRFERDLLPHGNANSGEFPDFNAINSGKPFDVNFVDLSTQEYLDVDQDRSRFRLRARVGMDVDVGQGFDVNIRLASGDGSTPVSTNQTLGGSAGDFSKYQIWLDQAYVRYQLATAGGGVMLEMGRFDFPFFNAKDLLWSNENVNTDGFAGKGVLVAGGGFVPFFIAGAFPLFNTALSFPATSPAKFPSIDKWLFGGQLGTDWKISEALNLKLGAAFYYYSNISGVPSAPCDTNLSYTQCNTDITRPSFSQNGNTYMAIRTPSAEALLAESTNPLTPRYQYFGLASKFHLVAVTARFDAVVLSPLTVTLEPEFVWNAGFSATKVGAIALNNLAPCSSSGECNRFDGGGHAFVVRLTFGHPTLSKQWAWSVDGAYLYVESDAVLDAFTNPDFFIGGTNLKGYILEGSLAVADNILFRLRWLTQDNIVGPTLKADVVQIDLWARF